MALPRQSSTWPSSGERHLHCSLQYATPTTDAMGGRGEPTWTKFGEWYVKATVVPMFQNEQDADFTYELEGPYRRDVVQRFTGGTGVRIVTTEQTFKVFKVENPQMRNRTLIAYCADAVVTQ